MVLSLPYHPRRRAHRPQADELLVGEVLDGPLKGRAATRTAAEWQAIYGSQSAAGAAVAAALAGRRAASFTTLCGVTWHLRLNTAARWAA